MINKEQANKSSNGKQVQPDRSRKESGIVDVAFMDVQCHIMIKDKDTKEVLVNKRG